MKIKEFQNLLLGNGINITDKQLMKLDSFKDFLLDWNEKINLISRKSTDRIFTHHFFDSLLLLKVNDIELSGKTLADVGAGGGFPAIPLAIMLPDTKIIMVESIRKKAEFLQKAIAFLELKNSFVVNDRFENFKLECDYVTFRAVGPIDKLIKLNKKVFNSARYVFYKSTKGLEELNKMKNNIEFEKHGFDFDFLGERYIIITKKGCI